MDIRCPYCNGRLVEADCLRSSHEIMCDCMDGYYYCVNDQCSNVYINMTESEIERKRIGIDAN